MAIFFDDVQGDVAAIFLSYFQRAPEFEAMQHYVGVLEGLQADPATADNAFNLLSAHIYADGVASQEVPAGPTVTDAWYVSYLYSNILGRAPDAEGQAYWTAQLASGAIERAELVATFIASALATEGRDAAYVENRAFVATEFAQWENSNPQVLPTLQYDAAEVLLGVNENPETVLEAQSRLEVWTGPVGETRNLTTGIDTFEGTTGNDTFNAVFESDAGWASTLTNFDTIDGDLGRDTLNIYVGEGEDAANASFPDTATVRNIEVVNIFNGLNSNDSLRDVSNYEGVEQFWQIGTARNVDNVGEGVLVGFDDVAWLSSAVDLAKGVTTANIALEDVGHEDGHAALMVWGDSLTTVNVLGDVAEDTDLHLNVVAGQGVRALVINTEVDTDLTVLASVGKDLQNIRINTLDLSGSTGDVEYVIDAFQAAQLAGANAALNVTFGSGDDVIIFGARDLTLRDNIDGGEGYDTVALTQDGKLQTQNYDTIARLQNIDQLAFLGENVEADASELTDFDLVFAGEGDVVVSNLADDQVITVAEYEDNEPDTVTLKNAAADVSIQLADDAGFQLIVDATNAASIGAKGGTLTLSGEGALVFSNAASGKFSTIDATELEGIEIPLDLVEEVLGVADADFEGVNLGLLLVDISLDDGLSFGAGMNGGVAETVALNVDTLDLIMVGVAVEDGVSNSSTYGKMDVIENFNSDAEAGPLDYLVGNGDLAKFTLNANDNTLQLAFQAAAQAYAGSDADVLYFTFGGDTYLFADTLNGESGQYDNADFALKIVGVHNLADQWVDSADVLV